MIVVVSKIPYRAMNNTGIIGGIPQPMATMAEARKSDPYAMSNRALNNLKKSGVETFSKVEKEKDKEMKKKMMIMTKKKKKKKKVMMIMKRRRRRRRRREKRVVWVFFGHMPMNGVVSTPVWRLASRLPWLYSAEWTTKRSRAGRCRRPWERCCCCSLGGDIFGYFVYGYSWRSNAS